VGQGFSLKFPESAWHGDSLGIFRLSRSRFAPSGSLKMTETKCSALLKEATHVGGVGGGARMVAHSEQVQDQLERALVLEKSVG
jgi:hypothetical protein